MAPSRSRIPGLIGIVWVAFMATPAGVDAATATVSNSLNANIGALGGVSVPGTATLTKSGTVFSSFTGTVAVQYRVRTSVSGGGAMTLSVTQDFQTGGPSVAAGDLTYSCGAASLGTACANTTASTTSATSVVSLPSSSCTGGGSPCSASDPNTVTLTFTLADRPTVKTGSYTATVQFTISAT